MITLTNGDGVDVHRPAGIPERVALTVEDNISDDYVCATVWATPIEARMIAALLVDYADRIDNVEPD